MSNVDFQSVIKHGHALASLEAGKMSRSLTDLSLVTGGQALPSQAPPPSTGLSVALHAPSIEVDEAKTTEALGQKESVVDYKEKGEEEQLERLAEDRQEEVHISHAISSGKDYVIE